MPDSKAVVYLASGSPRRRELLDQIGLAYSVLSVDVPESLEPGEAPDEFTARLARDKARAGWSVAEPRLPVIGADTAVALDGEIYGKPTDRADAHRMLQALSGRRHQVVTSVAVHHADGVECCSQTSEVEFAELDGVAIDSYWQSGEPQDKAGAYAIQGLGAAFITDLQGSYSGVMGLPLRETLELLCKAGVAGCQSLAVFLGGAGAMGEVSR